MWIRCSDGHIRWQSEQGLWSYFDPGNEECFEPVHSKIEAANQSTEVKAFLAKYPSSEILSGGHSVANSAIKYTYGGEQTGYAKEALLTVTFEGHTDRIFDFEIACRTVDQEDKMTTHSDAGKHLDVARFLQHDWCP